MKPRERESTKTSSFGVSKRESHDSTSFYSRRLYDNECEPELPSKENPIGRGLLDTVQCVDSRDMSIIPDESVHLMVTSPPYNVGKDYDLDLSLDEYRGLVKRVFSEVYKKLVNGGRACINVANLGRRPYIPLHTFIIGDLLDLPIKPAFAAAREGDVRHSQADIGKLIKTGFTFSYNFGKGLRCLAQWLDHHPG